MSIIGIGIDIIEIKRIKKIVNYFGNKFAKRILSLKEWREYISYHNNYDNIKFLAKRFSAKEAASKALGTGINCGIYLNELEIYNNNLGKPELRFLNNSLKKIKKFQCKNIHLSISDQKYYACALVVLEN